MAASHKYLAIDLGAESGRTIVGTLDSSHLTLTETYRFANSPVWLPDGLHWDVLRLWSDIKAGIAASAKSGASLDGVGLDAWGVDFALLDRNGALLANPFHYRDARTDGMLGEAFRRMSRADIFAHTGIQFMQINTLYQLLSMSVQRSPMFDVAETFVTIPDLLNYWLSGQIVNEFTNATTTQCLDPLKRSWAVPLLDAFGIPSRLFHPITECGAVIGRLLPSVAEEADVHEIPVVLPACHDTGSAVAAIPAENQDFAWISSGTWSIMGAEVHQPIINEKAMKYNFTNEGGVFGTWRFSRNIMGLWLVQECRRTWQHQGEDLTYDEITALASAAKPFISAIDPDDSAFFHPGNMPERIQEYCAHTNQTLPQTKGEIVRVALESIALKYRWVLERLEELTGKRHDPIQIIGGGTKNRLLNQFTADCTKRQVIAGPVEATAIGNIIVQAIALGHLASLSEARALIHQSFAPEVYEPSAIAGWDDAYAGLQKVME